MSLEQLQQTINSLITQGTLTLPHQQLDAPAINQLINSYMGGSLQLQQVAQPQIIDNSYVQLTAKISILNTLVDTIARFYLVDNQTHMALNFPLPDQRKLSDLFTGLKQSLFDELSLRDIRFGLASGDIPDQGISRGLRLFTNLDLVGDLAPLVAVLNASSFPLAGPVTPHETRGLNYPSITLSTNTFQGVSLSNLPIDGLSITCIQVPRTAKHPRQQPPPPLAQVSLELWSRIQFQNASIPLVARFGTYITVLNFESAPAPSNVKAKLGTFDQLPRKQLSNVLANAPYPWQNVDFQLDSIAYSIGFYNHAKDTALTLATAEPWQVIPNLIELADLRLHFMLGASPGNNRALCTIAGKVQINNEQSIAVSASTPDYQISGTLEQEPAVTLHLLLSRFVSQDLEIALPDLPMASLYLAVDPYQQRYRVDGTFLDTLSDDDLSVTAKIRWSLDILGSSNATTATIDVAFTTPHLAVQLQAASPFNSWQVLDDEDISLSRFLGRLDQLPSSVTELEKTLFQAFVQQAFGDVPVEKDSEQQLQLVLLWLQQYEQEQQQQQQRLQKQAHAIAQAFIRGILMGMQRTMYPNNVNEHTVIKAIAMYPVAYRFRAEKMILNDVCQGINWQIQNEQLETLLSLVRKLLATTQPEDLPGNFVNQQHRVQVFRRLATLYNTMFVKMRQSTWLLLLSLIQEDSVELSDLSLNIATFVQDALLQKAFQILWAQQAIQPIAPNIPPTLRGPNGLPPLKRRKTQ